MRTPASIKRHGPSVLAGVLSVMVAGQVQSQVVVGPPALSIADTPLFLTVPVSPNLIVTLDDSGSMKRAYTPDVCGNGGDDCVSLDSRGFKSARGNPMYYNPFIQYPAGRRADGSVIATSFNSALHDGFDPAFGTVNLENNYRPTAYLNHGPTGSGLVAQGFMGHYSTDARCSTSSGAGVCQLSNGAGGWVSGPTSCGAIGGGSGPRNTFCRGTTLGTTPGTADSVPAATPAYYYLFDSTRVGCDGTLGDNDCYQLRIVSATSGPGGTDERQNFANWYSFARTRNLATQLAASLAFVDLDPDVRVAWQGVNSCFAAGGLVDTDCDGWRNNFTGVSNRINNFSGTHRQNFYNWIFQQPTSGSTPLPAAMTRAGEYLRTTGENSPYDNNFATANSGMHSCRRNYHILMTDGLWNQTVAIGNIDNSTILLPSVITEADPDITRYEPRAPYRDDTSNTLSDVAMRYSLLDLNPALPNNLIPIYRMRSGSATEQFWDARNDPYPWQHMVNINIGLGLSDFLAAAGLSWTGDMHGGSFDSGTDPRLRNGSLGWPAASTAANNPANISDLWHAAINSRGRFFSADNPLALSQAFREALTAITDDSGSAASLSTNSTSIQPGNTVVYQAKFSSDWTGTLLALPLDLSGTVGPLIWDASRLIPSWSSRQVFTYTGLAGEDFDSCVKLAPWQAAMLGRDPVTGLPDAQCQRRLEWLRGSDADEQRRGGPYRNRPDTVMGDIVNSDPGYVKDLDYGYAALPPGTPGRATYAAYRTANAGRAAMIYVGANDGMLHAIRAASGVEQFAYVPLGVYQNLNRLTSPAYQHRYFVDGGITVHDAHIGGAWKTVLLAGLNAGGRTVYALDVTDPTSFDKSAVLWEFFDTDMGLSYSQPQVGILESGRWVAVFGNGYNSSSGGAILYVVDLASGTLLNKIVARDLPGNEGNGLSTPLLYDKDGDNLIDTIYAGDLQGNLWKFDASNPLAVDVQTSFTGQPLFTARNDLGQMQQITSQPKAAPHPLGFTMVLFGTGQYLTFTDVTDNRVQSYYGIRDAESITEPDPVLGGRADLQPQYIDLQAAGFGRELRSITGFAPNYPSQQGWYLDLLDLVLPGPSRVAQGERVISTSLVREDRVIFMTAVPSSDPCQPGGSSWLMELNFMTGGTFIDPILDLDNNGQFDDNDNYQGQVVSGVRDRNLGISKTPVWLQATPDSAFKVMTGTSGGFMSERNRTAVPPPITAPVIRRSWIQIR